MKKLQVVMLGLLAVLAFSAVLAASASAEETLVALWLANNADVVGTVGTEAVGGILLEDSKVPAAMLCEGILLGTVSANGKDQITGFDDLLGNPITLENFLSCTNETACGSAKAAPMKLPWTTQLFLMADGKFLDLIIGAEYSALCTVLGITVEDTCLSPDTEIEITNDLEDAASQPEVATPLGSCSIGGANSAVNQTDELTFITLTNGQLLTVSSE